MINLFKSNEGFSYSSFKGLMVNGVEQIPDEIKDNLIQVDDETYQKLVDRKLMWQNGELVDNPSYQSYADEREKQKQKFNLKNQISRLKQKLAETDYRAIKYFEGYYTEEEYAPYKAERQAHRDEINRLEKELAQSD